jgi:paraquat-inducible protein B
MTSDPQQSRAAGAGQAERQRARMRHGWWPGWIWGIPVAALLVVAWLGFRSLFSGNQDITITFDDVHGLKEKNTSVEYRGLKVGQVKKVELNAIGNGVDVTASIDSSATKFLTSSTRFWLRGASPSLTNLQSLGAVLSGPTLVMEPGPGGGHEEKHFIGLTQKPVKPSDGAATVLYGVSLSGEAGSVRPGDPVKLDGFTVGEVREVGFDFNPRTDQVDLPCTLALYPALFHVGAPSGLSPNPDALRAQIGSLIQKGLRARLGRDPPLVGDYQVRLEMVSGSPPVTVGRLNALPEIPFEAGGGVGSIVARLNKIPIEQITRNVLAITHHVERIVSSPQLEGAVGELDAALKQIHQTTAQAGPQITQLLRTLHKASDDLDQTAKNADQFVAGTATQDGLNSVTLEVTEAARAVRSLANYLDRHPEALIKGKGESE